MLSCVVSSVQSRAMMGPDAGLTCAVAVAALSLLEQLESTLLASVHAERQDLYAQIIWHKRSALGIARALIERHAGKVMWYRSDDACKK